MTEQLTILVLAGFIGGIVNAVAGGAKLFVFPLLLATGLSPVAANVTGTVAIWPAQIPALFVYRSQLRKEIRANMPSILTAAAGGIAGAITLIISGEKIFVAVVPFLLIVATATIGLGNHARKLVPVGLHLNPNHPGSLLLLFSAAFYGGFFGAGLGFMLLAVFTLTVSDDAHRSNAEKNLYSVLINTAAAAPLMLSGLVDWLSAGLVLVGGLAGGYTGARVAIKLPKPLVRWVIVVFGIGLTLSFLLR